LVTVQPRYGTILNNLFYTTPNQTTKPANILYTCTCITALIIHKYIDTFCYYYLFLILPFILIFFLCVCVCVCVCVGVLLMVDKNQKRLSWHSWNWRSTVISNRNNNTNLNQMEDLFYCNTNQLRYLLMKCLIFISHFATCLSSHSGIPLQIRLYFIEWPAFQDVFVLVLSFSTEAGPCQILWQSP
jgi:hypothetical protein